MLISDLTRQAARLHGDAPALRTDDDELTFAGFEAASNRFANAVLERGLRPGDRVAMLLPSSIEFFVVSHGLARAGLIQVPLNARESEANHRWLIEDSEARAMIGDCTNAEAVEIRIEAEELTAMIAGGDERDVDPMLGEGDIYRLSYTGGTTGKPKAVETTFRARTAEISCFLSGPLADLGPGDRFLHAAPVTHASGDYFMPGLIRGACATILPGFDPPGFLAELERMRATHTFLVPTMLAMLLAEPNVGEVDASELRAIHWAGSPLAPSIAARAEEVFGKVLYGTYGQAEAPMTLTWLGPEEHDRAGSAGRPYPLVEVRVVDAEDRPLPIGEEGEVVARGDLTMTDYWKRPDATAETLRNGWLHTGDIGRFDEDGYLFLLDRKGDMIISGGFNVYPREVEEALLAHPEVREAAVFGVPHETWGEEVVAAVSLTPDPTAEAAELIEFARARVSGFKRPRRVLIQEELPKSGAGKIVRRLVRDELAD
jgi:acyl-CoA synthetase (AMP-forming)/AMP-acid ligase II